MFEDIISYLVRYRSDRIPPKDLVERRSSFNILDLFENPRKIISVVGPRRAGKTYFVYQVYSEIQKSGWSSIYLNFEDERLESNRTVLSDFLTVVNREAKHGKTYLLLDEIQKVDEWGAWLRRVYDGGEYNILVTGSTSKIAGAILPRELGG